MRERILCVKTHAIGDALMTTPALRVLRRASPFSEIVVLTSGQCGAVFDGNPAVDDVLIADANKLQRGDRRELVDLIRRLRRAGFGRAYVFQRSQALQFVLFLARIPRREGLSYSPWAPFLTRTVVWPSGSSTYAGDMYLRVVGGRGIEPAGALSFPCSEHDEEAARALLAEAGVGDEDVLVALAPGGGRNPRDYVPQKRWAPERFAKVAEALASGRDSRVLLVGSADDLPCTLAVKERCSAQVLDFCGRTTLRTLAALLRKCRLLVTNDSAPFHVAVAMGTPTVTVFGPSNARALVPPGSPIHLSIQSAAACSPCYANEPFPGCDNWICMERVPVSEVVEVARTLLEGSPPPEGAPGG